MSDYFYEKSKKYYEKYKAKKLTKKVGSIVKDGNKYLTILRAGKRPMFAGGSVDEGETIKQAVVREALEEYGVNVEPVKYFGRSYYTVPMKIDGTDFKSNRVEYFYLCKVISDDKSAAFGLEGEFSAKNKSYKKVKLSLEEILALDPADLNDMNKKTYDLLVDYLKNNK